VDGIIPEPPGGAHEDYDEAARLLKIRLVETLAELSPLSGDALVQDRYRKFRAMGNFFLNEQEALARVKAS
jgi:acetyl-CoA carboxylase carboxyl transferase subunit alpha